MQLWSTSGPVEDESGTSDYVWKRTVDGLETRDEGNTSSNERSPSTLSATARASDRKFVRLSKTSYQLLAWDNSTRNDVREENDFDSCSCQYPKVNFCTKSIKPTLLRAFFSPYWTTNSYHPSKRSLIAYLDEVPDDNIPHIHIPNSVPLVYKIDPHTGKAVEEDSLKSYKSKGNWLLSFENQERLVDKVGIDSESFARSVFSAWDANGDGYLSKEELGDLLFRWKKDTNPAINALAGKILEEVCCL